jgi:hypothetical protein
LPADDAANDRVRRQLILIFAASFFWCLGFAAHRAEIG